MMDILPLHIEYLLSRHDCVILPGIGAFIATETEAAVDFEHGTVTPRRRWISFNSSVVTDDGLLSHSIARREHLDYEEAHRLMTRLTAKFKDDLDSEGEVSMGKIGRLRRNADGLIEFEPRISAYERDILTKLVLSPKAVKIATSEAGEASEDIVRPQEEASNVRTITVPADRYVFTIRKRVVHAAATLALVVTICLSILIPINHASEQKASVFPIEGIFPHPSKAKHSDASDTHNADTEAADSIAKPLMPIAEQ